MRPGSGRKLGKEMPPRSSSISRCQPRAAARATARRPAPEWGPCGSTGGMRAPTVKEISVPVAAATSQARVFEAARQLVALGGAQEAGLPFDHGAVGDDVELAVGAEEAVMGGEAVHEGRVAGHEAAGVDRGAASLPRQRLGLGHPVGGGVQGRAAVPVVEPGVGGLAARFEAPLEHAAAAGHHRLRQRRPARPARAPRAPAPSRPSGGRPPARARRPPPRPAPPPAAGRRGAPGRARRRRSRAPRKAASPPFMSIAPVATRRSPLEPRLVGREDGVEVADQQQVAARGVGAARLERPAGEEARVRRRFLTDHRGEAALAQLRRQPLGHAAQPPGIAAVRGDGGQLAQQVAGRRKSGSGSWRRRNSWR